MIAIYIWLALATNNNLTMESSLNRYMQQINPNLTQSEIADINKALDKNNSEETGLTKEELLALAIVESRLNKNAYSQNNFGLCQINRNMYRALVKAGHITDCWHLINTIQHNIEVAITVLKLAKQDTDLIHKKRNQEYKKKAILAIYNMGIVKYMQYGINNYPTKVMKAHKAIINYK